MLEVYGNYTVIAIPIIKNYFKYTCKCKCGIIKEVYKYDLFSGNSTQCKSCQTSQKQTTHGLSHTKPYQVWNDMISRCYNKNNRYFGDYGGRGISVCDEWKNDFLNFYDWFNKSNFKEGLTIDRRNNNGNYEPDNCRWVGMSLQNCNRRSKSSSNYIGVRRNTYPNKKYTCSVKFKGIRMEKCFTDDKDASLYRALYIIANNLPNMTEWKRIKI